ncbi:MAG: META domain-containing protein [Actinomycetota bacterium]|nr:META domain-containing protein [Actinomycetota bacterium]
MSGDYKIDDGLLTWFEVITTNMLCRYDRDGWFHDLLNQGVTATTEASRLFLTSGETQVILEQTP